MTTTINASTSAGLISSADTSGILQLQTANTDAVTIDASQNVGVGTASPSYKLDVVGSSRIGGNSPFLYIQDTVNPASDVGLYLGAPSAATYAGLLTNFASDQLLIRHNSATVATFSSAGNLGLGVTPSAWGTSYSTKALQVSASSVLMGDVNSTIVGTNYYYDSAFATKYIKNNYALQYVQDGSIGVHKWFNAPSGTAGNAISFSQAMTLDASGNLLVGTTSASATVGSGFKFLNDFDGAGNDRTAIVFASSTSAAAPLTLYSTGASAYRFYVDGAGTIYATSTTISAISDIRFKENVRDLDFGLDKIMALKPRVYDWKEGKGADIKNARGFIAQEFEEVFPDLIDEWKDPAPEGEAPYKSVRQDLIPVLVKAIQEQQALIQSLKARLDAANL